jgi:hypothetical protein
VADIGLEAGTVLEADTDLEDIVPVVDIDLAAGTVPVDTAADIVGFADIAVADKAAAGTAAVDIVADIAVVALVAVAADFDSDPEPNWERL